MPTEAISIDLQASLKINEIFYSLQGESTRVGLPTIFIRLTGCPLRCQYCDTEYAFYQGKALTLQTILNQIQPFNTPYVVVTGGEPLAQKNCLALLSLLCEQGYRVSLETSGALSIKNVDPRVTNVMDIKTPDSGEESKNHYDNIAYLSSTDQVKFVLCSQSDYLWCKQTIATHALNTRCEVLLSPSQQQLDPAQLADWILQDQLPVRFQLQLHKILWGDVPGK